MAMRLDEAVGVITETELMGGYGLGSRLQGRQSPVLPWVDVASGSLGQRIGNGVCVALAGNFVDKPPFHVRVLCGDSETTDGTVWEALDKASHCDSAVLEALVGKDTPPLRLAHLAVRIMPGSETSSELLAAAAIDAASIDSAARYLLDGTHRQSDRQDASTPTAQRRSAAPT
jgi:hypothetical protein